MKFGVVIFPGSNCDQDIIHVCREVMQCETRILWHKDTTLQDLTTEDCIMIPGGNHFMVFNKAGILNEIIRKEIGPACAEAPPCV